MTKRLQLLLAILALAILAACGKGKTQPQNVGAALPNAGGDAQGVLWNMEVIGLESKLLPVLPGGQQFLGYSGSAWNFTTAATIFTPGGDLTGNATSQYVQSLSGANATGAAITLNTVGLTYAANITAPTYQQLATTALNATGQPLTFTAQYSTNASSTSGASGNIIFNVGAPPGSSTTEAFVEYERNGAPILYFGADPGAPGDTGIWFAPQLGGGGPTSSNFGFLANSAQTYLLAPQYVILDVGGSYAVDLNTVDAAFEPYPGTFPLLGSSAQPWTQVWPQVIDFPAKTGAGANWTTSLITQQQLGSTGTNAGATLTIRAQQGQNVASGTNNIGGELLLSSGAAGGGGTGGSQGDIVFSAGALTWAEMGPQIGGTYFSQPLIFWASSALSPQFYQLAQLHSSGIVPQNLTIEPQVQSGSDEGSSALNTPGSLVVSLGLPYTLAHAGSYAQFRVQNTNGSFIGQIGPWAGSPTTYDALTLGPGITPSASNYAILSDGTLNTYLNAPGALGGIHMQWANAEGIFWELQGGIMYEVSVTSFNHIFEFSSPAATATTVPNYYQVIGQAPNASCSTGAACTPGSIYFDVATPGATGSPSEGYVNVQRGGSVYAAFGAYFGGPTYAQITLGPGTNPAGNWTIISDGSTSTYYNGYGTGILQTSTGSTIEWQSNHMFPGYASVSLGVSTNAFSQLFVGSYGSGGVATTGIIATTQAGSLAGGTMAWRNHANTADVPIIWNPDTSNSIAFGDDTYTSNLYYHVAGGSVCWLENGTLFLLSNFDGVNTARVYAPNGGYNLQLGPPTVQTGAYAPGNVIVHPEFQAGSDEGSAANNTPGSFLVNLGVPYTTTHAGSEANLQVQRNGTIAASLGPLTGNPTLGSVLTLIPGAAPSATNYAIGGATGQVAVNAPTSGSGFLNIGGSSQMEWQSGIFFPTSNNGVDLGQVTTNQWGHIYSEYFIASNATGFGLPQTGGGWYFPPTGGYAAIEFNGVNAGLTGQNIYIAAQNSSGAAGTNTGGSILLASGTTNSGAGVAGNVMVALGGATTMVSATGTSPAFEVGDSHGMQAIIANYTFVSGGANNVSAMWLYQGNAVFTPTTANYVLANNSGGLDVNNPENNAMTFSIQNSGEMSMSTSALTPFSQSLLSIGSTTIPWGSGYFAGWSSGGTESYNGFLQPGSNSSGGSSINSQKAKTWRQMVFTHTTAAGTTTPFAFVLTGGPSNGPESATVCVIWNSRTTAAGAPTVTGGRVCSVVYVEFVSSIWSAFVAGTNETWLAASGGNTVTVNASGAQVNVNAVAVTGTYDWQFEVTVTDN